VDAPSSPASGQPYERHERDLYELGLQRLRDALPDADAQLARNIPHPDLARFTIRTVYGELHARPTLTARDRELITLTVLATLGGCEQLLAGHVILARRCGLTREEILEAFLQCAAYAGVPRAIQATRCAVRVLDAQDSDTAADSEKEEPTP
jgi:4-carboxymuconolactone decarboxylase